MIVACQLLVADSLGAALVSQPRNGEVFTGAHVLDQALDGIGVFVIDLPAYFLQQLLLFSVHIRREEKAAPRVWRQKDFPRERNGLPEQLFSAGKVIVPREGSNQANGLDLAEAAHGRDGRGAIKFIQLGGDAVHIRISCRAAPQHAGDHGVHGGALPAKLAQQGYAEHVGFKFICAQGGEPYAGHDFLSRPLQSGPSFSGAS